MVGGKDLIIATYNCFVEIGMPDKTIVYEKELFAISFSGIFGFSDKSTDLNKRGLSLNWNQVWIDGFAEDTHDTLSQIYYGEL